MRVAWVRPDGRATGAPIVISHGLWDSPESFLGWAYHLARHGHPVLLPEHQGSDRQHKSAMVAGRVPPPGASELALRPMDITALLNALPTLTEARLGLLDPQQVGVVGHSWGAITTLQLGGLRPESNDLIQKRCDDQWDPERNLSWSLQCSLMAGGSSPSLADGRVRALVAVSPPARLLFDVASSQSLRAPTLLVSGTSDWVVPSGPEAITPFRVAAAASKGHRLVLAQGGDHFNLRAPLPEDPGVLGDVILSWMQTRLLPGDPPLPPAGGDMPFAARPWGNAAIPLVDVSEQLSSSP
jgi:predicted dienelactone hydrolase